MEDLRIYGFNIGAILVSTVNEINPYLQTVVLISTAVYTILRIYKNLKGDEKDK